MNNPTQSEDGKMASLEDVLDHCLRQQSKFLIDLFTNFFKMMKDELREFGKSLTFLSSRYDEFATSANEIRESLNSLSTKNWLHEQIHFVACDSEIENVKQYICCDMLNYAMLWQHRMTIQMKSLEVLIFSTAIINSINKTFPSVTHNQPQWVKSHRLVHSSQYLWLHP